MRESWETFSPSIIFFVRQLSFSGGKGARPGDSWRANSTSAAFRFRVISGFDIKAFLSESSDITRSRIQYGQQLIIQHQSYLPCSVSYRLVGRGILRNAISRKDLFFLSFSNLFLSIIITDS